MYDQLVRVSQIDREISELHQRLDGLYSERQRILEPPQQTKSSTSPRPVKHKLWAKSLQKVK